MFLDLALCVGIPLGFFSLFLCFVLFCWRKKESKTKKRTKEKAIAGRRPEKS